VSQSAGGSFTLTARATFTLDGEERTVTESVTDGSLTISTTTLTDDSPIGGIAIPEPGSSPPE
jgi:hypothetical protein